jgi:LacI family transcriptional regulator
VRRSTIADVAKLAGVSVGTVSNVLNVKGRYSETTRRRVLWAASELQFAPNALIRSLQSGKTNTIGVFTWRLHLGGTKDVSLDTLRGISRGLAERNLDALLYARHPHEGGAEPTYFLDGRVDGVILAPGGLSRDGVDAFAASGMCGVLLYQNHVPPSLGAVTIDNAEGVTAAVDHLVNLGHRRIAFVSPQYSDDFSERRDAYIAASERHGLVVDRRLVVADIADHDDSLERAALNLIRSEQPPTAILLGNDALALRLLQFLCGYGVRVPGDLSVVGFDDAPDARNARLSTIAQPAEEVGYQAALLVSQMLDGAPGAACRVRLPVRFLPRETTGPPAYV